MRVNEHDCESACAHGAVHKHSGTNNGLIKSTGQIADGFIIPEECASGHAFTSFTGYVRMRRFQCLL